ncbi:MAG: hypothetical protein JJU13_07800 [Balneolaceae bacterium]|nr:hypothetical protein [Balneolaceae bacterium]
MTKKTICLVISTLAAILLIPIVTAAQQGPAELADRLNDIYSERISSINNLTITVASGNGDLFPETTTRYVKIYRDGRDVLVTEDIELDLGVLSGAFDGQLPALIRAAHTISNETLDGSDVYRIEVDDANALFELGTEDTEYAYDDVTVTHAVVWMHRTKLYPLKLEMGQISEEGFNITVTLVMEDYRDYSGLPVPHRIEMKVDGMEDQIPESDLEYIRQYLDNLQSELEEMPEADREAAEIQMRPQIEQLQRFLESGGVAMGGMVFVIRDVQVNQ